MSTTDKKAFTSSSKLKIIYDHGLNFIPMPILSVFSLAVGNFTTKMPWKVKAYPKKNLNKNL